MMQSTRRPQVFRHDIMGAARVVAHSARQLAYNIQGFKAQQEKGGKTYGAKDIAKFWVEHARWSAGQEHIHDEAWHH